MIVLHYTAMDSAAAARARLCDAEARVSAHWLLDRDGTVEQLVCETRRAWHAGLGAWGQGADVNSRSIGIEMVNTGAQPFSHAQMNALERLIDEIFARWDMRADGVIGHSDSAPGRKVDPGPRFDWARLVAGGRAVGACPETAGEAGGEAAFVADMRAAGYTSPVAPDVLLGALRLRHRPGHAGPRDGMDDAIARDLAQRHPVAALDARAVWTPAADDAEIDRQAGRAPR